jgi:transcriptional regulator with XRE-family HTH domain
MNIGRKIGRIRELRGMKQSTMAIELGIAQQNVSKLENRDVIGDKLLEKVANILGVRPEGIRNFKEGDLQEIVTCLQTKEEKEMRINYSPSFDPMEKIITLYEEKAALLERLVKSEQEKVEILQKQNSK